MARQVLSLDTLGEIDGGAARAIINKAIDSAIGDVDDRGDDGKPRKVIVTITLVRMENGMVSTEVDAGIKVPPLRTAATFAEPRRQGDKTQLAFQQYAPEDPAQETIDHYEHKPAK